ncbi:hypothetical protein J7E88_34190 [Streptomyces sp. ISL-10]|uniref:hypothetical protein n=1 Tax=Streptomyces sp. ISL-10 TaxID=2819172 RepID=UPI001BE516CB|nr:hypothetical protein [Streptomyces sp. ISL-10]MBT2370188.1 hypothetical protein [Streptomyces sp. ISL-10]
MSTHYSVTGRTAILRIDKPPVNGLGHATRKGLRASDIDVVYIAGYGFPRYRGGPMFYADTMGAAHVLSGLRRFHGDDGWEPSPLLMRLAAEGGTFN